jgi:hypothetical protein
MVFLDKPIVVLVAIFGLAWRHIIGSKPAARLRDDRLVCYVQTSAASLPLSSG